MQTAKEAYLQVVSAKLDKARVKIDKWIVSATEAEADLQKAYQRELEDLRNKMETAQKRLLALQQSGGEAWAELKAGVDEAWEALELALESGQSSFNN